MELIETFTPKDAKGREANGRNLRGVCQVAYKMAMRDGKPYRVGPTAYGLKIGNFPPSHPQWEVRPNGEVYRVNN